MSGRRSGDDIYSMSSESRWHLSFPLTKALGFQKTLLFDILWSVSGVHYLYRWKPDIVLRLFFTYISWSIFSFFLPLSVHRLQLCVQALDKHANGDPQLLSNLFPLPLFLSSVSSFLPKHEMSSEEKSSTMSQKISSPSHSNSSSSSKHDSRQVSACVCAWIVSQ